MLRLTPLIFLAWWLLYLHRKRQEQIAENLAYDLHKIWQILDFEDLDGTQIQWVDAALNRVVAAREESQREADKFIREYRQALNPDLDDPLPPLMTHEEWADPDVLPRQLTEQFPSRDVKRVGSSLMDKSTSGPVQSLSVREVDKGRLAAQLIATGPAEVKRLMPAPPDLAMDKAFVAHAGAAVKVSLGGGRDQVIDTVAADVKALGWARFLEQGACYFCAMVASQGAVFKEHSWDASDKKFTGHGGSLLEDSKTARAHDNCKCTLRPVYRPEDEYDFESGRALSVWNSATPGYSKSNRDALNAFRRQWERGEPGKAQTPPGVSKRDAAIERMMKDPAIEDVVKARKLLPSVEKSLNVLKKKGFDDDSMPVKWHVAEIARLRELIDGDA